MRRSSGTLAAIVVLALLQPAKAEVFLLRSGGRIEGELMNADQNPRTSYVIAVGGGGQITLEAAVVEKVQSVRPELAEYEKMRRQAPDTVEGQMKLAQWCKEQGLTAQRKTHLERVLQLDPDQPEVRRLLGYRKFQDKWMTFDEQQAARGLVQHVVSGETRWITKQEADNLGNVQRQLEAEAAWRREIAKWRIWLDGSLREAGKKSLRDIHDAAAIAPLGEKLNGDRAKSIRKDPSTEARLIYVEVLGRFNTQQSHGPLATCAIDDPAEDVRICCLDELEKQKDEAVTRYFEARMSDKHASDEVIDRAGVALGRIKDPASVATLVNYVAYERTEVVPSRWRWACAMTTTFGRNGGPSSLGMNQKPKTVQRLVECRGVLDALVSITGQNFGYNPRLADLVQEPDCQRRADRKQ